MDKQQKDDLKKAIGHLSEAHGILEGLHDDLRAQWEEEEDDKSEDLKDLMDRIDDECASLSNVLDELEGAMHTYGGKD